MRRLLARARRLRRGVLAVVPAPAAAAHADETALAERYAPVVRLVADTGGCETGEAVRADRRRRLFGEPTVALRGPWGSGDLVKIGPTRRAISQGLYEYHLDFPGNALDPGCDYLHWQRG